MTRLHYQDELDSVRRHLIEMGDGTITLYTEVLSAIGKADRASAERAQELETKNDEQNRTIREECLNLITLQAPVARDARFVTAVLEAIVDLELIADYANEIAQLSLEMTRKPMSQILAQVSETGGKIGGMLSTAIDAWRKEDHDLGLSVRPREVGVRLELHVLYEKLGKLMATPGDGGTYITLLLIVRHLERIMRHAITVAESASSCAPASQATPDA